MAENETIVAIATAAGRGGIGIVRLAGPGAVVIAQSLLQNRRDMEPGQARFNHILDGEQTLDEAVVT